MVPDFRSVPGGKINIKKIVTCLLRVSIYQKTEGSFFHQASQLAPERTAGDIWFLSYRIADNRHVHTADFHHIGTGSNTQPAPAKNLPRKLHFTENCTGSCH